MSNLDELKLRYAEENPDEPSDDVETIAFHSTPHKPKPAPKAVKPRKAKAEPPEPPEKAVPLTMGLSHGVPTPNGASAALWLIALALAVILAATRAAAAKAAAPKSQTPAVRTEEPKPDLPGLGDWMTPKAD